MKHAKVRVSVECEKPLQFERRVQFSATGDEVVVAFKYDKLQKWCFICHRMYHDGKRCPDLEKERAHVAKHGYKDRNLRQQDVLRGELSPYNGNGKATKQHNYTKPPVSRKLFNEKEISPKHGRSTDKPVAESTKAWVVKAFGEKSTEPAKEADRRSSRNTKEDAPKQSNFKPASWYRENNVESKKAVSDPGKITSRRSVSNEKRSSKLAVQEKDTSSVGSQAMVIPVDVEEVISPMKDLLQSKKPADVGDDRGGRRGKPIKSRLGPRTEAMKKTVRSPYRTSNPRKRQALSDDASPKKRVNDNRDHGSRPLPPTVGPETGKKKEERKLVVDEIPPANPI